jgi:hypothetical protein
MKYRRWIVIIALLLLSTLLLNGIALAQGLEVTADPATNVTSDSATLNGNLNSLGNYSWAYVSFEWGGNSSYGNETPLGNMSITGPFSDSIFSLSPNTTYHFRAKALGNGTDPFYGNDTTFTTGIAPAVTTNAASNVIGDSATLNGNLTSLGNALSVNVSFEWGLTISYGNETTLQTMTTTGLFSGNLSSLSPGTTYHFIAKAVGNDTVYGNDMTFTAGAVNLQGWGWCTNYNEVVAITFDGYTTMVERTNAPNSYSMHTVGTLTLPSPYNETISLDMYGSRARLAFYLRQEVTGKSVNFEGTWIVSATGNETYIGMAGWVALPNPEGEALKTTRICFAVLRTPTVEVPLTDPGNFTQDLDSILTRFVKFADKTLDTLVGSDFAGILSGILQRIAVMLAHLRSTGIPYIP